MGNIGVAGGIATTILASSFPPAVLA